MDNLAVIPGYIACIVVIIEKIIQIVNHKRIRSNCCGREVGSSIDIENTTPPLLR